MKAMRLGAALLINTDAHGPGDLISDEAARKVLSGAGIREDRIESIFGNSRSLVEKALKGS